MGPEGANMLVPEGGLIFIASFPSKINFFENLNFLISYAQQHCYVPRVRFSLEERLL